MSSHGWRQADSAVPTLGRRARRLITHIASIAAVAVLGALALAPLAAADTIPAVGVNDVRSDAILMPFLGWNGVSDLNLLQGAGVQLYRARLQLNCVDPGHTGTFEFGSSSTCGGLSYDALVGALADRGMTLLPVLMNFTGATPEPPTATGAGGSPTVAEFAAFAAAAAARYGPTGSFWPTCGCTPHPIEAWEIWNEENNGFWWDSAVSPSAYATVFAATRAALRGVDPQARAVVGGLTFDPNGQPSFVAPAAMIAALTAANANAFDAVAVHPYTDATGASASQLSASALALIGNLAATVAADTGPGPGGAPRQQIWVTEMGWSDQQESPTAIAGGLQDFFAALQAGARARDNVGPVLWFDLRDNATKQTRDDQLGLRLTNPDGSDAGPKPVWNVFASAAQGQGTLALPPALPDAGPYVAAPSATTTTPPSASGAAGGSAPATTASQARVTTSVAPRGSAARGRGRHGVKADRRPHRRRPGHGRSNMSRRAPQTA